MIRNRRGFSIVEAIVAMVVLSVVATTCVKFIGTMIQYRKAIQSRQMAIQETANTMERLYALPWKLLTPESVSQVSLSDEARSALPGASLRVELLQTNTSPPTKRITVLIERKSNQVRIDRTIRLVAWRYKPSSESTQPSPKQPDRKKSP